MLIEAIEVARQRGTAMHICGTGDRSLRNGGGLDDIAPTVLKIMDLEIPKEMTGVSLV